MKTLLKALLFLTIVLGIPMIAHGQQYVQNISGTVSVPVWTGSSFKLILGANVTSFSFSGPPTSPGQIVVMYFLQDATGSRTVTFASNIFNSCTITSTASATTVCQFAYDQFSNSWFGVGASGGGGGFTAGGDLSGTSTSQNVIGLDFGGTHFTLGTALTNLQVFCLSGTSVIACPGLDVGATTANTMTYTGTGGVVSTSFATSGSNGGLSGTEGTGANCAIGVGKDCMYPDSTLHCYHDNWNNVDLGCTAAASNTLTFTNKTFDTGGAGNVFKIAGTSITAVSGTGAVCLASGSACGGGGGPAFAVPVSVSPPSGTTTSFLNFPDNSAGLGLMPLSCTSTTAATSISCATPKAIQTGQSIVFGYMYASGSATITSTGPNDSLGNAVTCSAVTTPAVISMALCSVNNSGAAGVDTITLTVSASVTGQWVSGHVYQGFVTSSPADGALVAASGNSSAPSSGAYTSTNANDLIVTAIGDVNFLNEYALGGGFNERSFASVNGVSQNGGIIFGDQVATSTGSFTGSLTLPAALTGRWIAMVQGYKLTAAPALADLGGNQTLDNYPYLSTDPYGVTQFKKLATQGAYALAGPGALPGAMNALSTQNGMCWIFTATTQDCLNASDGQLNWGNNINIQPAAGIVKAASFNSNVATGTAPLTVTSTTPVANLAATPTTYNAAGTQQTNAHLVKDTCTLGTSCSITLTGGAAFTSNATYDCWTRDATAPANAVTVTRTSGTALAFTGTGTDVINYVCVGN